MKTKISTKELVLCAFLLCLGLILPMLFHSFGIAGQIFLPMHIPILLGGLLLPPVLALSLGIITPIISSALTGMPVMFPMAIIMVVELGTYGFVSSILLKKFKLPMIVALIISMIVGRVFAGFTVAILAKLFGLNMNPVIYIKGAVITGIPGIIIQIIIIPILASAVKKYYNSSLSVN